MRLYRRDTIEGNFNQVKEKSAIVSVSFNVIISLTVILPTGVWPLMAVVLMFSMMEEIERVGFVLLCKALVAALLPSVYFNHMLHKK